MPPHNGAHPKLACPTSATESARSDPKPDLPPAAPDRVG